MLDKKTTDNQTKLLKGIDEIKGGNKMLDKNTIANQNKLREDISEIKEYLAFIEREINASDHVGWLTNDDVKQIHYKLLTAANSIFGANYFWAMHTDNAELKRKLGIKE